MLTSLQDTWKSLATTQRLALGGVLAVAFAGLLLVARFAGQPSYGVLFSDLEPDDAGAVTAKLRDLKVGYQLTQSGRTIEVPQEKVYDLRLALATEGLPRGGTVGFELFDKTNFGATDFTQRLNYQRALQGELTRTITRLEGVLDARVHLAIPEKRLFTEKEEPVTASVVLHLRPGHRLDDRRVAGIVHLVAASVEGLKPENVAVHDEEGELLSSSNTAPSAAGNFLQLQEEYERHLEAQLTRLAEQVLGPGRAAIRVGAELNWDQMETTRETFRPSGVNGKNLPVEEQANIETYGRDGKRIVSGIPGTTSNLARSGAQNRPSGTGDPGQYSNRQTTNRYAVSKVVERRIEAPGKVRRLSIAVLLDGRISRVQQAALREAFAAAAGLDMTPESQGGRGDQIRLVTLPFDRSRESEATRAAREVAKQSSRTALIRNLAAVAVVLLLLFTILVGQKIVRASSGKRLDVVIAEPASLAEPAGSDEKAWTPGNVPRLGAENPDAAPLDPALQWDLASTPVLAERLRRLARDRPAEVARQIQFWMME